MLYVYFACSKITIAIDYEYDDILILYFELWILPHFMQTGKHNTHLEKIIRMK